MMGRGRVMSHNAKAETGRHRKAALKHKMSKTMTDDELGNFAREKAGEVLKALGIAVGAEIAAEICIRVSLESLLKIDQATAAAIFRTWADCLDKDVRVH